jgi:hypothetical protein
VSYSNLDDEILTLNVFGLESTSLTVKSVSCCSSNLMCDILLRQPEQTDIHHTIISNF